MIKYSDYSKDIPEELFYYYADMDIPIREKPLQDLLMTCSFILVGWDDMNYAEFEEEDPIHWGKVKKDIQKFYDKYKRLLTDGQCV